MSENSTIVVTGTLSDEQTLILDTPVSLPRGRVRIIVESLVDAGVTKGGEFPVKLEAIRRALRDSGHQSRTKEEIDAELETERDSWDA